MSGSGKKTKGKPNVLQRLHDSASNLFSSRSSSTPELSPSSSSSSALEVLSPEDPVPGQPLYHQTLSPQTNQPSTIEELEKNLEISDVNHSYSGNKTLVQLALYYLKQESTDPSDIPNAANRLKAIIISLLERPFTRVTDDDWKDIKGLIRDQDLENLCSELTKLSNTNSSKSSSSSSLFSPAASEPQYPVLRYLTQWHDLREAAESSAAPSP